MESGRFSRRALLSNQPSGSALIYPFWPGNLEGGFSEKCTRIIIGEGEGREVR